MESNSINNPEKNRVSELREKKLDTEASNSLEQKKPETNILNSSEQKMPQTRFQCFPLDGAALKWIALITMIIDHTGLILMRGQSLYPLFRAVGRLSFPIYCFLLVEGFCHTSDVRRYALRLGLWGILSELPFDWMIFGIKGRFIWSSAIWTSQNIFFTLLIGIIALTGYVRFYNRGKGIYAVIWCFLMCVLATILHTDYSFGGVALICLLYRFRMEHGGRFLTGYLTLLLGVNLNEYPAAISFLLMECYNEQRGRIRYPVLFYLAYPLHLCILCLIRYFIG